MSHDINLNVNFSFPGLSALLCHFEGKFMSAITDALAASNAALLAHVTALETSVATLVGVANDTKVALTTALANGTIPAADTAAIQAVIDAQTAAVAAVDTSKTGADAAAAADTAAAAADPTSLPGG